MSAGRDGTAEMVETMMTADSLRLAAHGPDEDEIRIVADLPKAKPPHEHESLQRQFAGDSADIDARVLLERTRRGRNPVVLTRIRNKVFDSSAPTLWSASPV
jgi:hypothetical protein